jgi:hypothetical protein
MKTRSVFYATAAMVLGLPMNAGIAAADGSAGGEAAGQVSIQEFLVLIHPARRQL